MRHLAGRRQFGAAAAAEGQWLSTERSTSPSASWLSTPSSGPPRIPCAHLPDRLVRAGNDSTWSPTSPATLAWTPSAATACPTPPTAQAAMDTLTINY